MDGRIADLLLPPQGQYFDDFAVTKHVCIISPAHLSTNPRLVKEALALRQAGYKVSVVHGRFSSWGTANDRSIARRIGRAYPVTYGPYEASLPTYLRQSGFRRAARLVAQTGLCTATLSETAHSPVTRDLKLAAQAVRADLYIAHYVAALPAAAAAAKRYCAPYAFDAEDFHLGDLPDLPEHNLEKRIIRNIEGRYIPHAAFVTAASPLIAKAYVDAYGITLPTTVLNLFPRQNAPVRATHKGSSHPGPSIYWFSQTIGPGRGLETAIEAIAKAESRPHLYLRGTPAQGYEAELRRLAAKEGAQKHLHFLEPVPPDHLEQSGSLYDLGFVGEVADTRNRAIAITNKLFSYLLSGLPSLASDIQAHRSIAPELGQAIALFSIGDAASLATSMDEFLLDESRLSAARAHAWQLGQERYNWESEAPNLLKPIQSLLDDST